MKEAKIVLEWAATPHEQRLSIEEVARQLGRTPKALAYFLHRQHDPRDQGRGSSRKNEAATSSWTNGRPWTAEQEEELCEMASTQTIPTIAKGLCRSEMAVRLKLKGLRFEYQDLAGFKTKDLADMLGVTVRQVRRWRHKGYLSGVNGRITEESLLKFCRNHADKIPYQHLDASRQLWLRGYGYRVQPSSRDCEVRSWRILQNSSDGSEQSEDE